MGWIQAIFNIPLPANVDDTMAMASMVDENLFSFSLDNLCKEFGLPGKDESLLRDYTSLYRIKENEIKKFMHDYPADQVGPYAEQDAVSTLDLAKKLRPIIVQENLTAAYQVERELMPITLKMKQRGIRVDVEKARTTINDLLVRCHEDRKTMATQLGMTSVEMKQIRSSKWILDQFARFEIKNYPRTPRSQSYKDGQPSLEKNYMASHNHWFPRAVQSIKHRTDLAEKFLDKFIIKYAYHGRVHPSINQFRSETGGARSHRFSYSDPPLQQIPSRDEDYAATIRSCFLPEEGEQWCSIDYRQQEYRLIVFVAEVLKCRGAKQAGDRYRNDPSTDFHDYVASITRLPRRRAKDVNFAKSYGAGVKKFALMTGMSEDEAITVMDQYDAELPFVREAAERYSRIAKEHGYIKLIDGARNHFNLFEPKELRTIVKDTTSCHMKVLLERLSDPNSTWGRAKMTMHDFKLAFTRKAFNRMIQGSAARQVKKAMVDVYKAGFQPILQLHDELCFSVTSRDEALACAKIMEKAMPIISIPMLTDVKLGPSWGELKK
jgi:DNA polymerase I-like protein with 3'-5' exonuclease and polymerase domains